MNAYIINNPQLQSPQQRVNSFLVWIGCWLMWFYLLLPVITLGGWLLGEEKLLPEMRWFGGYKSLLQLLEIYVVSLFVIACLWLVWVLYHNIRKQPLAAAAHHRVTDEELSSYYHVCAGSLKAVRKASVVTVHFDANGNITLLKSTA